MIAFFGKATNSLSIDIEESQLPADWKDLNPDKKLNYLMANYAEHIFSMFIDDLEVEFDFEEDTK